MADREFSAGGIIVRGGSAGLKILLIKDSYGHWTWPKGKIDKDETKKDAATREIEEETGLSNIEVIKEIAKSQYFYRLKESLIFKTVYVFLVRLTKKQRLKVQTEEIQDAKWFSPKAALGKVDYKGSKEILKEAISAFDNVKYSGRF